MKVELGFVIVITIGLTRLNHFERGIILVKKKAIGTLMLL